MSQFDHVSVVKTANVYFDGKCVSHTVILADGTRKSVGVILPSTLTFNTGAPEIMELLKRLNETKGLTVLMVLHELNLAAQYSHHIGVMQEGRLVTTGSAQEVITESLLHDIFHVRSTIETVDEHVYVKIKGLCD